MEIKIPAPAGFDFKRTHTSQTYIGFGRGRYSGGSVQGFQNYLNNPANSSDLLLCQMQPL